MIYFGYYLLAINLIGAVTFIWDKRNARHTQDRIREKTLHKIELLGSVCSIILLMHTIRHKNRKASYYKITYLCLLIWIAALLYFGYNTYLT